MKYKTWREYHKALSLVGLFFSINSIIVIVLIFALDDYKEVLLPAIMTSLLGTGVFIYCWTSNYKRNKYKRYGKKYEAYIYEAKRLINGRGEDTFYLTIAFYEDGIKKFHYTEGYVGNPNFKLRNSNCAIYKWKNKYIEADFSIRDKKDKSKELNIPISKYHHFNRKK